MVEKDKEKLDNKFKKFQTKDKSNQIIKNEYLNKKENLLIIDELNENIELLNQINLESELNKEDYICVFCLSLIVNPVTTDCNHSFCFKCFELYYEKISFTSLRCPVCRESILYDLEKNEAIVTKNKTLEKLLMTNFQQEYFSRLSLLKNIISNHLKIRFAYGNTYKYQEKGPFSNSLIGTKCVHFYTLFFKAISISEIEYDKTNIVNEITTSDYIKSVKYTLHSTYKNPERLILSEPFEFKAFAWGWFDVPIEVTLQDDYETETGSNTINLDHTLIFEEAGQSNEIVIRLFKKQN